MQIKAAKLKITPLTKPARPMEEGVRTNPIWRINLRLGMKKF